MGAGSGQSVKLVAGPDRGAEQTVTTILTHHPTQPGAPILCDFGIKLSDRLRLRAGGVRPKHQRVRLPSPSTAARTTRQ